MLRMVAPAVVDSWPKNFNLLFLPPFLPPSLSLSLPLSLSLLLLSLTRGHREPISVQLNPRWHGRHREADEEEREEMMRGIGLKEASSGFSIQYVHNDFH